MKPWSVPRVTRAVCALASAVALLDGRTLVAQAPAKPTSNATSNATISARWLTRPERTDYAETSRYDDVIAYMKQMAAVNPNIHLTTYGYTTEGRPLPLAVIGAPGASAAQVLATNKTRVYIQGNIHAGEVEGKEALLWLLRSIAKGERNAWLKTTVLLINPIYNADGNERVSVSNRGSQAGPVGGMGTRENAQGLDLNRDGTKMETAEARSMASLLTRYQPHVAMDLHTTDGSSTSGFNMTYETSLNPNNAKAQMSLLREVLLPEITKTVKAKHGSDWFYYGGVSGTGDQRAWRSDAELAKPRYTSTYYGVRNILGLLTETYSYASFKTRITETYWFLEESLGYVATHGETVRDVVAKANAESIIGQQLAVRQQLVKAPALQKIVFAPTISVRNPYVADRPYRLRPDGLGDANVTSEMLPFFGTAEPTETTLAPRVWVVPMTATPAAAAAPAPAPGGFGGGRGGAAGTPTQRMLATVIDRLEAHGIRYSVTAADQPFSGDRFKIATNTVETREYQGTHKGRTLTGAWEPTEQTLPAGSLVIPMDQPLARLTFILMDPRSDDGFMWWNLLDAVLGQTPAPTYYPVLRSMNTVK
ncbi:M14 family zinc carboxypeptidase [Gemmatimonas sp.]|uniref:M14 family zinc carboxypeptidase n=1 Tax=Gemmatimonas sp. TaxID=1962908 RepID=UPI00286BA494|nr:M14 family zinc carboxypeptidase [Gemmatimonas sp.]